MRWFQFGAFCPLFRSHGRTWKLRLPWGWNTGELGPERGRRRQPAALRIPDPSELHNAGGRADLPEVPRAALPTDAVPLHAPSARRRDTGLPIMRALWLHYPRRCRGRRARRRVPVGPRHPGRAGRRKRRDERARLSAARPLVRLLDGKTCRGGREVSPRPSTSRRCRSTSAPERFSRSVPCVSTPWSDRTEPVTLEVYPGANGAFTLYDDDGRSFDYQGGDWMGIDLRWDDQGRRLSLRQTRGSRLRPPAERPFRVRVAGSRSSRDVRFTGRPLEVRL